MEQRRIFRTSFNGFHREDVNRYISEISKKLEECGVARRQAEVLFETTARERDELKNERERLTAELAEARSRMATIQSGNELLLEKTKGYFDDKAKSTQEIQDLREQLARLEQSLPALNERAERFEQSTRQIAEVLISARAEADRIVGAARENAAMIRARLQGDAGRVYAVVGRMVEDYAGIREGMSHYSRQLEAMLEDLYAELTGAQKNFQQALPSLDGAGEAPLCEAAEAFENPEIDLSLSIEESLQAVPGRADVPAPAREASPEVPWTALLEDAPL
ncbi:MAG: hypothetical protein GXX99_07295 [Clostridiales bacterium]|nr:hypothetical protein [Clostridiales bacterium]